MRKSMIGGFVGAAVAIAIALVIGLAIKPAPAQLIAEVAAPVSTVSIPELSADRISPAELSLLAGRGEVLILDVREAEAYLASHIDGALHIPLSYIESEIQYLRRGKKIITYCT